MTDEGVLVAAHAREIDRSLKVLDERLKTLRHGKSGVVRIGSFGPSATSRILPNLLTKFATAYPGISVSILEGTDERTRSDLEKGNVDVAVLAGPLDCFEGIPIATDQLVALVQDGSPASTLSEIDPADIEKLAFVMTMAGSESAILDWFASSDSTPNVQHRIQQTHSILQLVGAGMGVAIVTSLSLPDSVQGVTIVPLKSTAQRQIFLARMEAPSKSVAVDILWRFLEQSIYQNT